MWRLIYSDVKFKIFLPVSFKRKCNFVSKYFRETSSSRCGICILIAVRRSDNSVNYEDRGCK